jgi:NDP-sugar pyrophosphorylase family protein
MIGIIPAAGSATRMMGIPKMLLPIPPNGSVLIDLLIERMKLAGVGEWPEIISSDVVAELIQYHTGIDLYHAKTKTMSETVLCVKSAWEFAIPNYETGKVPIPEPMPPVLFGMPDTYFDDGEAFVKLAAALDDGADVAVGLFKARPGQRKKLGMCDITPGYFGGHISAVIDKPQETNLVWAWGVLGWKPTFWQYIQAEDPHVGYALPRAIAARLDVRAVRMVGEYFDCGTPDEYFECIEHLRRQTR